MPSSGLKLTLPPLTSLRSAKASSVSYNYDDDDSDDDEGKRKGKGRKGKGKREKIPRPVKLKPLKEVITKLIAQIKKKDAYAFFLTPVPLAETPGYTDIVSRPMDFGTVATRVAKGRYRSLAEFTEDVALVTSNAKAFNPPGTIYYTEAERIESWALDHIAKIAPTVLQYETDWGMGSVDIGEDDDDASPFPENGDHDSEMAGGQEEMVVVGGTSTRRTYRKVAANPPPSTSKNDAGQQKLKVVYTIEPDGHLPGGRDGLGAFPSGSDWAAAMVKLKLKGKRYKTKKERLRIERYGPPMCADGSLDYTEMEDPFSILSVLVPDPPLLKPQVPLSTRPVPSPLPPPSTTTTTPTITSHTNMKPKSKSKQKQRSWTVLRNQTRIGREDASTSTSALFGGPDEETRDLTALDFGSFAYLQRALEAEMAHRRRNESGGTVPTTTTGAVVPGVGGIAPSVLSPTPSSLRGRSATPVVAAPPPPEKEQEQRQQREQQERQEKARIEELQYIRESMQVFDRLPSTASSPSSTAPVEAATAIMRPSANTKPPPNATNGGAILTLTPSTVSGPSTNASRAGSTPLLTLTPTPPPSFPAASLPIDPSVQGEQEEGFYTRSKAIAAEESLRSLVYGGPDGWAYIRSLAEFVSRDEDDDEDDDEMSDGAYQDTLGANSVPPADDLHLGMPLAEWVARNVIDPLTDGRHALMRNAHLQLRKMAGVPSSSSEEDDDKDLVPPIASSVDPRLLTSSPSTTSTVSIPTQLHHSVHTYPAAARALKRIAEISKDKIDMSALLLAPDELFVSEEVWAGGRPWKAHQQQQQQQQQQQAGGDGEKPQQESMEMLAYALAYTGRALDEIIELRRLQNGLSSTHGDTDDVKMEDIDDEVDIKMEVEDGVNGRKEEDADLRLLRLNLLALAKRAPLDTLARVSKDLVPERIRHLVPTLD